MMKPPALLRFALGALLAVSVVRADEPARGGAAVAEEKVEFLRLSRDDRDRPLSLDTSIVEYGRRDEPAGRGARPPLRVDLVAAV